MSTSALVAQTDLSKQLPSCSYPSTSFDTSANDLDVYSWQKIFENVASSVPLKKALEFKTLHSEAYHAVNRAFKKVTKLKIEVYESQSTRLTGTSTTTPTYIVQDSITKNGETAIEMVRFVLSNTRCLKHLDLYFEDQDLSVLNRILDEVIKSNNVKLEVLRVKRRHAGQSVRKIGEIVSSNCRTLREISRIGISEASIGFNNELNLERFACMSFDLGFQPTPNQIPSHFVQIAASGAKFQTLSYTSFSGFDPTDDVVQNMLEKCNVESMKLTMMNAPKIMNRPSYLIGKVRGINKIELVEIVPEPRRINKLTSCRHVFEKVFPNAHNVSILQQWD